MADPRTWEPCRLGDHLLATKGASYKGSELEDETANDRLMSITAIRPGGGFKPTGLRPYSGRHRPDQRCDPGDIVIALTDLTQDGSMLGSPALVPTTSGAVVASHHVARIHDLAATIDPDWLYYRLQARDWLLHAIGYSTGTTVRQFRPSVVEDWELRLPPLDEQRRIAAVLLSLDRKIDSNSRLAAASERTADYMRRKIAIVGDVAPPGWSVLPFPDLVEVNPRVPIVKGDETPFIAMADVGRFSTRPLRIKRRPYSTGCRYEPGDVLMAKITGCIEHGKGAFVDFIDEPGAGSTEFLVLRARPGIEPELVFSLSRDERLRSHALAQMTGTSGRQRVPTNALSSINVAISPDSGQRALQAQLMTSAFRVSHRAWAENNALKVIRDALLPDLVTGKRAVLE